MTLDEVIKREEEVAKEQEELYRICPASESWICHCDGRSDCKTLSKGAGKGCLKLAKEHQQLAEWLKDYKRLKEQKSCVNIPFLLHKETGFPLYEFIEAYEKAYEYLRSKAIIIG